MSRFESQLIRSNVENNTMFHVNERNELRKDDEKVENFRARNTGESDLRASVRLFS